MAVYHLKVGFGSRAGGQSARAKNEYIERDGRYAADGEEREHVEHEAASRASSTVAVPRHCVQARQRAEVGPSGVDADRGVGGAYTHPAAPRGNRGVIPTPRAGRAPFQSPTTPHR